MQISGSKNCLKCGAENALKHLFSSSYYDDCKCVTSGAEKNIPSLSPNSIYDWSYIRKTGGVINAYKKGDKAIASDLVGMTDIKFEFTIDSSFKYTIIDENNVGRKPKFPDFAVPAKYKLGCTYVKNNAKVTILENPKGWIKK